MSTRSIAVGMTIPRIIMNAILFSKGRQESCLFFVSMQGQDYHFRPSWRKNSIPQILARKDDERGFK